MIWCILESKSAALLAAAFVDFPKKKCNFLHKNKLDIQFLTGRRPIRSFFSWGSRCHCPVKVGIYGLQSCIIMFVCDSALHELQFLE